MRVNRSYSFSKFGAFITDMTMPGFYYYAQKTINIQFLEIFLKLKFFSNYLKNNAVSSPSKVNNTNFGC